LGEYGGYWGTAAGNVLDRVPHAIPNTILREQLEECGLIAKEMARRLYRESGLVPRVEFPSELKELGIIQRNATIELRKFDGLKGVVVKRGGQERRAVFYKAKPVITGMMTNIDIDDRNSRGIQIPHFSHEVMVTSNTGIKLDAYQSLGLWIKEDEHASVKYISSSMDSVREFILKTQNLPDRSMPVTQGVLLYLIMNKYGLNCMLAVINEMNEKFPIGEDHPFYSRLRDGKLEETGYNTETLIQKKLLVRKH
jgi:hypothetical protein